jgi:NAD(P)-dependent dehydrogenase (short-subunit alcohol dehydrogenase family)
VLAVTGRSTTIVQALAGMVDDELVRIDADLSQVGAEFAIPTAERFVLAAGVLVGKPTIEQSPDEIMTGIAVNLVNVIRLCDRILATNKEARICVVGSESGFRGSYDGTYAVAKAAVHRYVEMKALRNGQQLVAVAPHIILNSGMTRARKDYDDFSAEQRQAFITPREVAECIKFLLWSERAWINNSVIRMAG